MNDTSLAYAMSQIPLHVGVLLSSVVAALVALSVSRSTRGVSSSSVFRRAATVGLPLLILGALLFVALARSWAHFDKLEDETEREATALLALERQSRQLGAAEHLEVRTLVATYARRVVEDEFPAMARGERPNTHAPELDALTDVWVRATVAPEFVARAHETLDALYALRRTRAAAVDPLVSTRPFLLGILLLLVSVREASEVLVGPPGLRFLLTTLVVLVVLTGALLVSQFSLPFAGDLTIDTDAFVDVMNELR